MIADSGIRNEIAGVAVSDLAARYGSPFYAYDVASIDARLKRLEKFDVVRYAQKAWSNLAVLDHLRRRGALVDSVSGGEILRALAAGYSPQGEPPPIVYTADLFDDDALRLVVEHEIPVNCGSPHMIEQLAAVAPGREITLRINPGFGHGLSQKTNTGGPQSKHGIWHSDVAACLEQTSQLGLTVTGIHMHIGSGTDFEHLSEVCRSLEDVALSVGDSITNISAGGGLPIPYRAGDEDIDSDRYFELWDATRRRLQDAFGHPLWLEIEPGRYLVAEAGYLVTQVRAVKQMGPNLFYLVDAGFNNLARPILYGAYHPMSIAPADGSLARSTQSVIVGGPLCESGDIFTQEEGGFVAPRQLPLAEVGDWLVIECAGAYGQVMASNYNSKPFAAEVWIDHKTDTLIRPRQSLQSLFDSERIPAK